MNVRQHLSQPVDAAPLALFRMLFGILMMWEVVRYWRRERIERYYVEPEFFFSFIDGLPTFGGGIYVIFFAMFVAAFFLSTGFRYRLAAIAFFILYTYVFLIDKTHYNNHYYLICLLALLFSVTDANRRFSLDARRKATPSQVPRWQIFIFQFQIVVVFLYAGIAKINEDWLAGEPVRAWLRNRTDYVLLGPLFTHEWFVYFYAYMGLALDISIAFLLCWKRTRLMAFPLLLGFNFMNWWFYDIGIFPYLAVAVYALFLDPDALRRWLRWELTLARADAADDRTANPASLQRWIFRFAPRERPLGNYRLQSVAGAFLCGFVCLQVFYPLLHFAIPGNVSWTEEKHYFAWHMKLRDKDVEEIRFFTIAERGVERELSTSALTRRQRQKMASRPHMIIQYARYLGDRLEMEGEDRNVHVRAIVTLNDRHRGRLIDERIDLSREKYRRFAHNDWIVLEPEERLAPGGRRN